jgi:hypothetical protein
MKLKRNEISIGYVIFEFIMGMLMLFYYLPASYLRGAITTRGSKIYLSEQPYVYWTVLLAITLIGIFCFYLSFITYKKVMKNREETINKQDIHE